MSYAAGVDSVADPMVGPGMIVIVTEHADSMFKQDHDHAQLLVLQQRDLTVQIENINRD